MRYLKELVYACKESLALIYQSACLLAIAHKIVTELDSARRTGGIGGSARRGRPEYGRYPSRPGGLRPSIELPGNVPPFGAMTTTCHHRGSGDVDRSSAYRTFDKDVSLGKGSDARAVTDQRHCHAVGHGRHIRR
jgi:hypothetical protein